MNPFALAHAYGIDVVIRDFGDGAAGVLIAEYEPRGPLIRINARALARAGDAGACALARRAVAHELYHHRERSGEVERLPAGTGREAAADDFARGLVARCEMR